jgi:transcriptional/translational regulatory protein YebC/TACO1
MVEIFTELESLQTVRAALEENGIALDEVSVIYDPNNPIELDQHQAVQVMKLVEILEELEDVQNVYTVLDISDEVMAAMEMAG